MPWLLGLALLHSLSVSEQRGIFNYWTILFSLFAFAFSLLGTFIVRSGVLTSVHAFAVDSERGGALLLLFFLLTVGSLTLFALKVNLTQSAVRFSVISREFTVIAQCDSDCRHCQCIPRHLLSNVIQCDGLGINFCRTAVF